MLVHLHKAVEYHSGSSWLVDDLDIHRLCIADPADQADFKSVRVTTLVGHKHMQGLRDCRGLWTAQTFGNG